MRQRRPLLNRDISKEQDVLAKVQQAITLGQFDRACFEVGQFTEQAAVKLFTELNAVPPKNAKSAIDYIMYNDVVSRPLGAKLHLVRELRNCVAHKFKFEVTSDEELLSIPPYQVTYEDASLCSAILQEFLRWISEDEISTEWNRIVSIFDEVGQAVNSDASRIVNTDCDRILSRLYEGLDDALSLKLHSIGRDVQRWGLRRKIEQLGDAGIEVRSPAWRDLANYMNAVGHGRGERLEILQAAHHVRAHWSEFLNIRSKLDPNN